MLQIQDSWQSVIYFFLKVDRANEDVDPKMSPSGPFLASLVTEWYRGFPGDTVIRFPW